MIWLAKWKGISARVHALVDASRFHIEALAVRSSDSYGGTKEILKQLSRVYKDICSFKEGFKGSLPQSAALALEHFADSRMALFTAAPQGDFDSVFERFKALVTILVALESEVSYLLLDVQEQIKRRCELAFHHLQRLIVIDHDTRQKWVTAFDDGERSCEKLGAVHLLLHGIWAFKVDADGARTDLVFEDTLKSLATVDRVADGLVLTEWKIARSSTEATKRFADARRQAERYAIGALAGIELTSQRYAIVVSSRGMEVPEDVENEGVVYRHVNIAVDLQVPSRP